MGGVLLLWIVTVVVVLLAVVGPRRLYWAFTAPFYRDPDANEPSDLAYGISWITGWAGAIACLVLSIWMTVDVVGNREPVAEPTVPAPSGSATADDVRGAVDRVAKVAEATSEADFSIGDVLREESGNTAKVSMTSVIAFPNSEVSGDSYEVTNADGANPVCLYILWTPGSPSVTQVTDGACAQGEFPLKPVG